MIPTITNLTCLYVFCHYGNQVTQRFQDIARAIYQLNWYELPYDMKKTIPMIISLSQKNIYLQGLAGTRCTLEVFMNVGINNINLFNELI